MIKSKGYDEIKNYALPGIIKTITTTVEPPFHIALSTDPFDDNIDINISLKGSHPALGLEL